MLVETINQDAKLLTLLLFASAAYVALLCFKARKLVWIPEDITSTSARVGAWVCVSGYVLITLRFFSLLFLIAVDGAPAAGTLGSWVVAGNLIFLYLTNTFVVPVLYATLLPVVACAAVITI